MTGYVPPFGIVEQRGLEYMKRANLDALDRHLYTCLLVRADTGTRDLRDRIVTLSDWSGMSERRVQQGLAVLLRHGMIGRTKRLATDPGGPQGRAWVWLTTVMPYESWSPEPLVRIIATTVAYVSIFYRSTDDRAGPASSPEKSTQRTTEERAPTKARARTATRDNPDADPESYPERSAVRSGQVGMAAVDVVHLTETWVRQRLACFIVRFTDATAVGWLRQAVKRAVAAGCVDADLDAALRQHVREDFADPRKFDQWAVAARDERVFEEAERLRTRQRSRRELEHDERVRAERAAPGYAERLAAVRSETRAKLSMSTSSGARSADSNDVGRSEHLASPETPVVHGREAGH